MDGLFWTWCNLLDTRFSKYVKIKYISGRGISFPTTWGIHEHFGEEVEVLSPLDHDDITQDIQTPEDVMDRNGIPAPDKKSGKSRWVKVQSRRFCQEWRSHQDPYCLWCNRSRGAKGEGHMMKMSQCRFGSIVWLYPNKNVWYIKHLSPNNTK